MQIALTSALLAASVALVATPQSAEATPMLDKLLGRFVSKPSKFTSAIYARATPDQIVATGGATPAGQVGALGRYNVYLNSDSETICWDILLEGVTGEYMSAARTATHMHQAPRGSAGPPRLALPNPQPACGCIKGPCTTGLVGADGMDTGSQSGFSLKKLQDSPESFFADTHTETFTAGTVRGQLKRVK